MNINETYDPQDIESLLLHKEFNELDGEEQAFALEHTGSEEEYTELRETLLNIKYAAQSGEIIQPKAAIKQHLLDEFKQQQKPGSIWLNSLAGFLFPADQNFMKQPAFQVAFAAMLVVGFIYFYPWNEQPAGLEVAELTPEQEETLKNETTNANDYKLGESNNQTVTTDAETDVPNGDFRSKDLAQDVAPGMEEDKKPVLEDQEALRSELSAEFETKSEEVAEEVMSSGNINNISSIDADAGTNVAAAQPLSKGYTNLEVIVNEEAEDSENEKFSLAFGDTYDNSKPNADNSKQRELLGGVKNKGKRDRAKKETKEAYFSSTRADEAAPQNWVEQNNNNAAPDANDITTTETTVYEDYLNHNFSGVDDFAGNMDMRGSRNGTLVDGVTTTDSAMAGGKLANSADQIKGRSLAEDEELIDLLFTAL